MKIYTLITHYDNAAPDMEYFSELPTMDFTISQPDPDHNPHCNSCPTKYELYEGYLDGGDTRDILILACYTCNERHAVTKTRVDGNKADPSEVYTLTCSHDVLAGC